jgi:hypothetical protein
MASFKDNKGREWNVDITVNDLRRIREKLGVRLDDLPKDGFKGLADLMADVVLLVNVVFLLCDEQAAAIKVTDEEFGRSLGGDAITDMVDAFIEAYCCFCPSRLRLPLRTLAEKVRTMELTASTKLNGLLMELDLDKEISKEPVTDSPALRE